MKTQSASASAFPRSRVAVSTAFLANGFVLGNWTPEVPVVAHRLGLSETRLGLLILVFGIGAIIAMPLIGAMTARLGSRRPVLVTQALLTLALPLLILAPTPLTAAVAILFFGMMMGGMDVAMNANAVSVERTMPRAIMSSCHGFWSIGGFAGAAVGGPLIATVGPLAHTVFVGIVTLIALVFVSRSLFDDAGAAPVAEASDTVADAAGGIVLNGRGGARLAAVAIGFCALFGMIPEGAAIDWSAIYLRNDLSADVVTSGFAFAAFSATMALFRFMGDRIRDRFGAVRTIRLSLLFGMAGLLAIGLAPGLSMALVGFAILGIGLSNIVPIAFSAAGNVEGLKPGIGISIATTIGYSGILIAPSAIGFLAEHFGFQPVFLGLCACLAFILALSGLMAGADANKPAAAAGVSGRKAEAVG